MIRSSAVRRSVTAAGRGLLVLALVVLGYGPISAPATAAPGPAAYPEYWFDQWGVAQLWAAGARGGGITIAIIDTGVQASVPQLQANVVAGTDLTGLGGDGRVDRSQDQFSHGTAMASLIVAQGGDGKVVGVAPGARILPIAVPLSDTDNTRPVADETAVAIRYAADHGAKIISMSFGGERSEAADRVPCPSATQSAVFYALAHGAILVASSGNSGQSGSPVEEPSVCLGVISVGAVDAADHRSSFSSIHPYLTVAAPGEAVTSLNRNGEVFIGSGTSQAAALTSGALALIWSAHPAEDNRQIAARLMAGLRDVGPPGPDADFGYGVVDADASVAATPTTATPNPAFAGADPFLAQLASSPQDLPIPAAAVAENPTGSYRRSAPPTGLLPTTVAGAGAASAGLVALIVLLGYRWRRRRPVLVSAPVATPGPCGPGGPQGYPPFSAEPD
ncbi:MAG: peptidase and in kexin sedolisin [Pseudonocardiales bacterium]|nr:peptidase and in kexin sedolisin [Pseudonocardiales bacterium]